MHFSHPSNRHVRTPTPLRAVPHENLFREPVSTNAATRPSPGSASD
jgi:hypothetical protein